MPATPEAADQKASVRRQFGATAANYAQAMVHRAFPDLGALVAATPPLAGLRVLDVGTGAGHTAVAIAEAGAREVVALDLTPAMLGEVERASRERSLSNLSTREGDAEALPFDDASFDLVTCRLCAHHFPDARRAAAEMARVLRPGGRVLLSDSISPEDATLDTFVNTVEWLRDPSHVRNLRSSEWLAVLRDVGLADVRQCGVWPCPLDFDEWVERMQTPESGRQALRYAFAAAPAEARSAFRVGPTDKPDFEIEIALFQATRPH